MGVPGQDAEDDTICGQGCAMSSVSMALAGYGVQINGAVPTPQSLNNWLRKNNGYHCMDNDCCNLVLDAPTWIAPNQVRCLGESDQAPFLPTLRKMAEAGIVVLLHVPNPGPHHFVLMTGLVPGNETAFAVNDPYYTKFQYDYTEIHDVLVYDMLPSNSTAELAPELLVPTSRLVAPRNGKYIGRSRA